MAMTLGRRLAVLVMALLMALMMVAGPVSAAETYKGKGNGYGWVKNNGGAFPGGSGGCDFAC
jgi:hypothetical protein